MVRTAASVLFLVRSEEACHILAHLARAAAKAEENRGGIGFRRVNCRALSLPTYHVFCIAGDSDVTGADDSRPSGRPSAPVADQLGGIFKELSLSLSKSTGQGESMNPTIYLTCARSAAAAAAF